MKRIFIKLIMIASILFTQVFTIIGSTPVYASGQSTPLSGYNAVAVTTGNDYTCALTIAGGVKCWGYNNVGQLGNNSTTNSSAPVDVDGLTSGVSGVAAGNDHTCALTSTGGVKCWGNNSNGQLGNNSTTSSSVPVDADGLTSGISAISAGDYHTCALTTAGNVKCWGNNGFGELGDNSTNSSSVPVDVSSLSEVAAIASGGVHTCALTMSGGVKCWGNNGIGQLGDGTASNSSVPVDVSGLSSGVSAITSGANHSCALTTSGGVKCWGFNNKGQLGDSSTSTSIVPVNVTGLSSGVSAISAGELHTCAVTTTKTAKCWGFNDDGQLGNDSTAESHSPVDVSGLEDANTISADSAHTCALTTTGGVKCWGNNSFGQLGDGTNTNRYIPANVVGLPTGPINAVVAGSDHSCALTTGGGVKCWGRNVYGELGNGIISPHTTPLPAADPQDVIGLTSGVDAIAAGTYHTCALTTTGGVQCWGDNLYGQLGNGITIQEGNHNIQTSPAQVTGLTSGITAITAGTYHACALTTIGGVKCWGINNEGELGDNSTTDSSVPVDVIGLSNVIAISAGASHTCALTTAGGVKCWGFGYFGQLGNGATGEINSTPVDVIDLTSGVTAIASGGLHTCAPTTSGGVKCWGYNYFGQLGDGTYNNIRTTPVDVSGLSSDITALAGGAQHTCALTTSGGVKCRGDNLYGRLGNDSETFSVVPVYVKNLVSGASAIAGGSFHTCAVTVAGGVLCWGKYEHIEIGENALRNLVPTYKTGLSVPVYPTISISANPVTYNRLQKFTVVINTAGSQLGGTGQNVQFKIDGIDYGLPIYIEDGKTQVSITKSDLPVGVHLIQAIYSGNDIFAPGVSAGVVHVVKPWVIVTSSTVSEPGNDGWTLESGEFSSLASTKNNAGSLRVGDDKRKKQYRSILSFNITTPLPKDAILTAIQVVLTKNSISGDVSQLGDLVADIKKGSFDLPGLEVGDFSALPELINTTRKFIENSGVYTLTLTPGTFKYISQPGTTQFRVRFTKDDNNNFIADYISFYGDGSGTNAPKLLVKYYIP